MKFVYYGAFRFFSRAGRAMGRAEMYFANKLATEFRAH